jgi:hypothetical protein
MADEDHHRSIQRQLTIRDGTIGMLAGKENMGAAHTSPCFIRIQSSSFRRAGWRWESMSRVHVFVLAGLDILVEEVHSPPCHNTKACSSNKQSHQMWEQRPERRHTKITGKTK